MHNARPDPGPTHAVVVILHNARPDPGPLRLVSAGVGCALVPVHEELHSPDIRFVPLQGLELSREIGLAWRQQTEIISTFIKLALDSGGGQIRI